MRIAVFGPGGMLGRQVCEQLGDQCVPIYKRGRDLIDIRSLTQATEGCDGIINCAGVIPIKNTSVEDMIYINTLLPHKLAELRKPLVLVSTDCVFSGRTHSRYQATDIPDPRDYYGKSKALGEVIAPHVSVCRTSFIGCDHGIMAWLLSAGVAAKSTGETVVIDGYKNAFWTGSTVGAVAHELINILVSGVFGVHHVATEQMISKHDLLLKLIEAYTLNVQIKPVYYPVINRALTPTIVLPNIDEALRDYPCRQLVAAA